LLAGLLALADTSPSALAAAPTAKTNPAVVTVYGAQLNGTTTTGGLDTSVHYEYALNSDLFCTSGGAMGTPSNTPTTVVPGGFMTVGGAVNVTGLTGGSTYCFRLVASNSSGASYGAIDTFVFSAAPAVIADSSVSLTADGAVLSGTGMTGFIDTSVYFQYALASDPFCVSGGRTGTPSSSAGQVVPGGSTPFGVSATVAGLTRGDTYCFRLVAANGIGTSLGAMSTFPFYVPPEASGYLTTTGARTATVSGSVFPALQPTSVEVDYDLASSAFCKSGAPNEASLRTAAVTVPASGALVGVVLALTGLTPGDQYCAAIVARNATGTASSMLPMFAAGVPSAQPLGLRVLGDTAAHVAGWIDPVGQTTTYDVAYDTLRSPWCHHNGATGAPSFSTTPVTLPFTDARSHEVIVPVTGLSPRASYCLALVARNSSGTTVAGPPFQLPATPKLTVSIVAFLPPVGAGTVTSSPNGISCPGRCSATFPRGSTVKLLATPAAGSSFFGWSFPCNGSCGYEEEPCISTPNACTLTLSDDATVPAQFGRRPTSPPSCVLTPQGRTVQNLMLALSAICTASVRVTMTATLTEIPKNGKARTFRLRGAHPTQSRSSWSLSVHILAPLVAALRRGAREALTITLLYSNPYGKGRTTATIKHVRVLGARRRLPAPRSR
jgi:hypothetical protein